MAEQTMVEIVTAAIHRSLGGAPNRYDCKECLGVARVAIEAMRARTFDDCMNVGAEINLTPGQVDLVWVRMIDAALAEGAATGEKAGVTQAPSSARA